MAREARTDGYAVEVARLLWPEAAAPAVTRARARCGPRSRDAYVFPGPRRPRLLMPAGVPGSEAMLDRLGKDGSGLARALRAVVRRPVGSPAFPHLRWPLLRVDLRDDADSIEGYLGRHLGTQVRVGVILGTPRANRKPVLQLFSDEGHVLGYAKIGHNPLTTDLVRREGHTLAAIARAPATTFEAPALLHHGRWRGLEVMAMSALSGDPGVRAPAHLRLAAMREVAELGGTHRCAVGGSPYWRGLEARAAHITDARTGSLVAALMTRVLEEWAHLEVDFGSWHGDWGFWNMAVAGDVVRLWDWERFDRPVPVGFDGLHFSAQRVRPLSRDLPEQERRFLASVPGVLSGFGVPPDHLRPTLALYLVEMAVRYAVALDEVPAPALRRRLEWTTTLLGRQTGTILEHQGSPA